VRILDLAQRLAKDASAEIAIDFVGLGPGERLHEQLFSSSDDVVATPCEHVFKSTTQQVDPDWLSAWIAALAQHVDHASASGVRAALTELHAAPDREPARSSAGVAR
jgi:FlaA1/EpsC-like NDP-sugar epimerase